jgi:hypothetical protein
VRKVWDKKEVVMKGIAKRNRNQCDGFEDKDFDRRWTNADERNQKVELAKLRRDNQEHQRIENCMHKQSKWHDFSLRRQYIVNAYVYQIARPVYNKWFIAYMLIKKLFNACLLRNMQLRSFRSFTKQISLMLAIRIARLGSRHLHVQMRHQKYIA